MISFFLLPTASTLVRKLETNAYQLDMEIGQMFLNFTLHPAAWKCCGLSLKGIKGLDLPLEKTCLAWTTLWMGFRSSPENAAQCLSKAERISKGEHFDTKNPFHWTRFVLNMPGSSDFNPYTSWGNELNESKRPIAGDRVTLADDILVAGFSMENC